MALLLPCLGSLLSAVCWLSMHFYHGKTAASDALRLVLCFGSLAIEIILSVVVAMLDKPSVPRIRLQVERQALMSLIIIGSSVEISM
jgi:hypothetical protein